MSALILVSVIACNKTLDTPSVSELKQKRITVEEAAALGVYDDSSQDIEEEFKLDDSPILDLNTRAGGVVIGSVKAQEEWSFPSTWCGKKYDKIDLIGHSFAYNIRGSGFGASAGSSGVSFNIKNITGTAAGSGIELSINSWTDTLIVVTLNYIPKTTYNTNLTFSITKDGKTVSKTIKVVGVFELDAAYPTHNYVYGQTLWELIYQRKVLLNEAQYPGDWGEAKPMERNYVPIVGDIVMRTSSLLKDAAIVKTVVSKGNGLYECTLIERNMKCTNALQVKKYKYMKGLFIPKTGEAAFDFIYPVTPYFG